MIEILKVLSCISYYDFLQIMNQEDDYYSKDKFSNMKCDLAKFLCELDQATATNFVDYASRKAGDIS